MNVVRERTGLTYQARARIADNLLVARRRAGLSKAALEELAIVSSGRIAEMENGKAVGMLDTYVRLAGALGVTLDDVLAGVMDAGHSPVYPKGGLHSAVRGARIAVTAHSCRIEVVGHGNYRSTKCNVVVGNLRSQTVP